MRKFILCLLTLVSVTVFAQKRVQVEYDFTNPTALNPSIKPSEIAGGGVPIDNRVGDFVFKEGENGRQMSLNFIANEGTGAKIATSIQMTYSLKVGQYCEIVFTAEEDCYINSIFFPSAMLGGIRLPNGAIGDWDNSTGIWKNNTDQKLNRVTLKDTGANAEIKRVIVEYFVPTDILDAVCSIENGKVLEKFKEMALTFKNDMKVVDGAKVTVEGADGFTKEMEATVKGNIVTLSFNDEDVIEIDGTYTVKIPAGSFEDTKDGFRNKELEYTFDVVVPKNTFDYAETNPAEGKIEAFTNAGIVIRYDAIIGNVITPKNFALYYSKDGETPEALMSMTMEKDGLKNVALKFGINLGAEGLKDPGTYTITIPEGSIFNSFTDEARQRYNAAFTLTYTIGDNKPVTDPELLEAAKELLKHEGLGYPKAESDARTGLVKVLADAEETKNDEALQNAINAFYAEKAIELPAADKHYIISNVNSEGHVIYLAHEGGMVTLTDRKAKAAYFAAEPQDDGTIAFKTLDGKYLHALVKSQDFDLTSTDNVTPEYNAVVNNLTLAKLDVENTDVKALLGKISIKGYLGKDLESGEEKSAYVIIRHSEDNIGVATDAYRYATPKFDANISSAFVFEETVPDVVETVEVAADLTPKNVNDSKQTLTLKFTSVVPVIMAGNSAAYFTDKDGNNVGAAVITPVANKSNEFTVVLTGLTDGTYTLVVPEAMFTTEKNEKTANVAAFEKSFSIGEKFPNHNFGFFVYIDKEYCFDTDLNNFVIYAYEPMSFDPTKELKLIYWLSASNVLGVAHMEKVTVDDMINGLPVGFTVDMLETNACKIVFDEEIKEGDLPTNIYNVIMETATIGDANFGEYLNGNSAIKESDCNVNNRFVFAFKVDNSKATGISDFNTDESDEKVIYTIAGRRVKSLNAPGIYIVNGKKVIRQ